MKSNDNNPPSKFPGYSEVKSRDKNLLEYIHNFIMNNPHARTKISTAINNNQLGGVSRIFDELPSLENQSLDEFASSYLNAIENNNFKEYSMRKITDILSLLVDFDPRSAHYGELRQDTLNKFLEIANLEKDKSSQDILAASSRRFPQISNAVNHELARQVCAAIVMAISSRFNDAIAEAKTNPDFKYKDISKYDYLSSGFKMDKSGDIEIFEGPTFKTLISYEIVDFSGYSNVELLQFIQQLNSVIDDLKNEPNMSDILNEILIPMRGNCELLKEEKGLQPNYVAQRKALIKDVIEEKLHLLGPGKDLKGKSSGVSKFTNLFLSKQSKEESEAKAKRKIALTSLRDRLLEDKPPAPTNTNRNV